jgi:putative SOS response-associated peptidase YedK
MTQTGTANDAVIFGVRICSLPLSRNILQGAALSNVQWLVVPVIQRGLSIRPPRMCNLYSMTTNQEAIRRLARVFRDNLGNQPPLPAIFPDQLAPVVRLDREGERALDSLRWGFPPPPKATSRAVTNVRNYTSPHWRPWLKRGYRCLVPATSFSEYTDSLPKVAHWFALDETRPLFAFAGIWRPWTGARGTKAERKALQEATGSEEREHHLFAFLTTEANEVVRPVHAKAMPVILPAGEAWDVWLEGETEKAMELARPLPEGVLKVVAVGPREDVAAHS